MSPEIKVALLSLLEAESYNEQQHAIEALRATTACRYCGGLCDLQHHNSEFMCDGYAGDIDNLYSDEKTPSIQS